MYPFHLIISTEVPDFDPSMAEYDKDRIKSFFSDIGYNKKFLESIDDDFCNAFHKARTAIFKILERKYHTLEELEQERKTSAWISVKDRLPEEYATVLVYDGISVWLAWLSGDKWWDSEMNNIDSRIIYWMPISKLPNGENL